MQTSIHSIRGSSGLAITVKAPQVHINSQCDAQSNVFPDSLQQQQVPVITCYNVNMLTMIEHIHPTSAIHVKPSAKNTQSSHVPYPLSNQGHNLYALHEVHLYFAF